MARKGRFPSHFLSDSWTPEKVYNLASGLSEKGVKRICIYMETRAEWMIAAHACFQHNIQVVTVYSTLGEKAVAQENGWHFCFENFVKKIFLRNFVEIFYKIFQS